MERIGPGVASGNRSRKLELSREISTRILLDVGRVGGVVCSHSSLKPQGDEEAAPGNAPARGSPERVFGLTSVPRGHGLKPGLPLGVGLVESGWSGRNAAPVAP